MTTTMEAVRRPAVEIREGESRAQLVGIFLLGSLSLIFVNAVGTLFLVQPILLAVALNARLSPARKAEARDPALLWFAGLAVLWLAGTVLADTIHQSSRADYLRGWAAIIFTVSTTYGFVAVLRFRRQRVIAYGFGLTAAMFLQFVIQPGPYARAYPWKFGLAMPVLVAIACLTAAMPGRSRWWAPGMFWAYSAVSLALGGRSIGGTAFMAGVIILWTTSRTSAGKPAQPKKLLLLLPVALLVVVGVSHTYDALAASGSLGDMARQKYEMQTRSGANILLSGRPEVVYGLSAAFDSPIIGHGSFAGRDTETDANAARLYDRLRMPTDWEDSDWPNQIPTHSHVVDAWVRAGILGVFFWLWLAVFFVRGLVHAVTRRATLGGLPVTLCLMMLWDIPFSPYGRERLIIMPFAFIAVLTAIRSTAAATPHPGLPVPAAAG